MTKKVSDKQITANQNNALKGGVKTPQGKSVSSRNAIKHGLFTVRLSEDEQDMYSVLSENLKSDLSPKTILEEILLERICSHIIQLNRISNATNEFIMTCMNPGVFIDELEFLSKGFTKIIEEPYKPDLDNHAIEILSNLYHRYEVSTENRLYKSVREYRRLKE